MGLFSRKKKKKTTVFNPNVEVDYGKDQDVLLRVMERHVSVGSQTIREQEFSIGKREKLHIAMRGEFFVHAFANTVPLELSRIVSLIEPNSYLHRELSIISEKHLKPMGNIPTTPVLISVANNVELSLETRQFFFALIREYALNVYMKYHGKYVPMYSDNHVYPDHANRVMVLTNLDYKLPELETVTEQRSQDGISEAIENASGEKGNGDTTLSLLNRNYLLSLGDDFKSVSRALVHDKASHGYRMEELAKDAIALCLPRDLVWSELKELVIKEVVGFHGVEQEETLPELPSFDEVISEDNKEVVPEQDNVTDLVPVAEEDAVVDVNDQKSTIDKFEKDDIDDGSTDYSDGFDETDQEVLNMLFAVDNEDGMAGVNGSDTKTMVERVEEAYDELDKSSEHYTLASSRAEVVNGFEVKLEALQVRIDNLMKEHHVVMEDLIGSEGITMDKLSTENPQEKTDVANTGFFQLSSMEERRYRLNNSRRAVLIELLDDAYRISDDSYIDAVQRRIDGIDGTINEVYHSPEDDELMPVDPIIAETSEYTEEEAPLFYEVMKTMGINESLVR